MKTHLIIFFLYISQTLIIQAQSIVIDSITKQPLPYVHITCANNGTLSHANGQFHIPNIKHGDTLTLSSLGYHEKSIIINKTKQQNDTITLSPNIYSLDEIVISSRKHEVFLFKDKVRKPKSYLYNTKDKAGYQVLRFIQSECESCYIKKVSFYCRAEQKSILRLRIYDIGTNNIPQQSLVQESIIVNLKKGKHWVDIPLLSYAIAVPSFFFVGVEFLQGDEKIGLGLTHKNQQQETFIKSLGYPWINAHFLKTPKGKNLNLMLKVELEK